MAYPNSKSTTAKRIKKGLPVQVTTRRFAVVLVPDSSSVEVTYLTAFAYNTQIPASLTDSTLWYPVSPAREECIYEPLQNVRAQWASLRRTQTITTDPVDKVDGLSLSEDAANLILAAMRA